MVAIFAGLGSGFLRGSGTVLGSSGVLGSAVQGRGGEGVSVNAATGNLLISRQDEFLVGRGPDLGISRTYNSLAETSDGDNGDQWQMSTTRRVFGLTGTLNTSGSTISRQAEDGSVVSYWWSTSKLLYVMTSGDGAFDTLVKSGSTWVWTDGASQTTETYEASAADASMFRIKEQKSSDNYKLSFSYVAGTDKLYRVTTANDGLANAETGIAEQSYVEYVWSGNNIAQIVTGYTDYGDPSVSSQPPEGAKTNKVLTRTRYGYDGSNRLVTVTVDLSPENNSISDGKTYVTTYTYDGSSKRVATITQTDGSSLAIAYDTSGRVQTLTQTVATGDTRVTSLVYGTGYTNVTGPDGQVTRLDYDAAKQLTKITAPPAYTGAAAQTIQFGYDGNGNVTSVTDGAGEVSSFTYDGWGNQLTATDANGSTVTRTYGAKQEVLTETRTGSDTSGASVSHTTRYVYDSYNRLRYTISAEGRVTEYRYLDGNLAYIIEYPEHGYPVGSGALTETMVNSWRDGLADKSSVKITYNQYDTRGNLYLTVDYADATAAGGSSWTEVYTRSFYWYDQSGRLLSQKSNNVRPETFVYDGLGRLVASTDVGGATTTIVFNDTALTTTVTTGTGFTAVKSYNKAGELIAQSHSGSYDVSGTASYLYDKNGRLRVATDATGHKTYYLYDKSGRKIGDINSYGNLTEYRYDATGRVSATVHYTNSLTATEIAALGDPDNGIEIATIRPVGHGYDIWSWSIYDDGGRLIESIDGDGGVTSYSYDASDRLIKTVSYAGKLTSTQIAGFRVAAPTALILPAADSAKDAVVRSFYDRDGLLVGALDGEGYLTENIYDASGRRVETVAYAAKTSSSYWASGSFEQLRASASPTSSANRRTHYVYDNRTLRYTIDASGRVEEYTLNYDGNRISTILYASTISTSDFTYDNVKALVTAIAVDANDRERYTIYNSEGRAAYTVDAGGKVTGFMYDSAGRVIKQIDFAATRATSSLPALSTMDSWASGQASNSGNRVTRNWYTASGDLRFTVDGEGYVSRFDYDAEGRRTRAVQWANQISATDATDINQINTLAAAAGSWIDGHYEYDATGRRYSVHDGEDNRSVFFQYGNGTPSSDNHAYGTDDLSRTVYANDGAGRTKGVYEAFEEAEQATVTYSYDGIGNRVSVTDARGKVTSYTYDRRGLVLTVTDAAGGVTSFEYNAFGEVVKATDAKGGATYSYYDNLGRVVLVRDAEDYVTRTSYTDFGEIASITRYYNKTASAVSTTTQPTVTTHAKDATTSFDYDKRGLVTKATDAEGFFESYGYDAFGNRTSVTAKSKDASKVAGGTTTYSYDRRGLLVSETLPVASYYADGSVQASSVTNRYVYDARGNRTQMIEADGLAEERVTTYVYDKANRLIETWGEARTVLDPSNHVTTTAGYVPKEIRTYDGRGNVTSVTDPAGGRTVYYYDDLDRVVVTIDAAGTYAAHSYDANGNVTETRVYETPVTVPADGGSEEEALAVPSGASRATSFTYDNLNRLLTSSVAGAKTGTWTGSSWTSSTSAITTTYQYDALGNVVKAVDANGKAVTSYYDALSRKTAEVDAAGYLSVWTYDDEGRVLTERRYATRYTGTPSTSAPPSVSTNGADRVATFTYDRNGNRLSEARSSVIVHNGSGGTSSVTATVSWLYNGLGEVIRKTEATGEQTDYVYDAGGQLTQEKRAAFTSHQGASVTPTVDYRYTGLGDLARTVAAGAGDAAARVTTYSYGTGGLLASMTDAEGATHSYAYDKRGLLVRDQYYRAGSAGGTGVLNAVLTTLDALGRTVEQTTAAWSGSAWTKGDVATTEYNAWGEVSRSGINGGTVASASRLWQTENKYDAAGRLWATNAGDGVWKVFGYDKNGNQTIAITSAGTSLAGKTFDQALALVSGSGVNATYTVYDARNLATSVVEEGRQLSASSSATLTTSRSYNAFGEVVTETNANGNTTSYSYNNIGRMTRSEGPAVEIVLENGKAIWVKPSQDYYYDASGRLVATRDANGSYAETGTSAANATSKAANSGNLTRLTLLAGTGYGGGEALVTAETHADGGIKTTKYDIHGDARTLIDEVGRTTTQVFDKLGRVIQVGHAGGLVDSYAYDSLGQQVQHWNNLLGSSNKETTDYDTQGRVTSTRAFGGDITSTSYAWNAATTNSGLAGSTVLGGWTQTTTYANSKTLTETSDVFGHQLTKNDLGSHVYSFTYDAAGRIAGRTGGGETLTHSWLNTGLVGTITSVQGGVTTSQVSSYDALGNKLTESQTRAGSQIQNATATYDALNRLATWSEAGNSTTYAADTIYAYDANSNIRYVDADYRTMTPTGAFNTWDSGHAEWYRYDSMNRMVLAGGYFTGTPGSGTIAGGTAITYDAAGRRATVTTMSDSLVWTGWRATEPGTGQTVYADDPMDYEWDGYHWTNNGRVIYTGKVVETYSYDDAGLLEAVHVASAGAHANGTSFITPNATVGASVLRSDFAYDLMGRVTSQQDYEANGTTVAYSRTNIVYNAKGQVASETQAVRQMNGTSYQGTFTSYITNSYGSGTGYALGAVLTNAADVWKNGVDSGAPDTLTTNTYAWYDGAVLATSAYKPDSGGSTTWTSTYSVNATGAVTAVDINDGRPRDVSFKNDVHGQAIRRDEADALSSGDPHGVWYRFNGREMGRITNDGAVYDDYASSIGDRQAQSGTGAFQFGAATGKNSARFGIAYEAINSFSQGSAGGGYTVEAGDTLQSIAERLYGDASLWYKIAEANGLSAGAILVEGRTLGLPPGVSRNANSAATFKPYDPAETLGNTSPTTPKPGKANKCGMFGQILIAVVAAAVTVASAAGAVALATSTNFASGLSTVLGTSVFGGTVAAGGLAGAFGATGAVAVGAGSAALGSIASQGVGVATGIQGKFNWKGVGLAALGGGVGASGLFGGLGNDIAATALRGAGTNALVQGLGAAAGLQSKFDFAGVAAAGIGAAAGFVGGGNFAASLAASTLANAATRSAITGNSFGDSLNAALPDAIAQIFLHSLGTAGSDGEKVEAGKTVNIAKTDPKAKSAGAIDSTGEATALALTGSTASVAGGGSTGSSGGGSAAGGAAQSNNGYEVLSWDPDGGPLSSFLVSYQAIPAIWTNDAVQLVDEFGVGRLVDDFQSEYGDELGRLELFSQLLAQKAVEYPSLQLSALAGGVAGLVPEAIVVTGHHVDDRNGFQRWMDNNVGGPLTRWATDYEASYRREMLENDRYYATRPMQGALVQPFRLIDNSVYSFAKPFMHAPGAIASTISHPKEAFGGAAQLVNDVLMDDTPARVYLDQVANNSLRTNIMGGAEALGNVAMFIGPAKAKGVSNAKYASSGWTPAAKGAPSIADDAFVRFDPTLFDDSINAGGIQSRYFSDGKVWLTKYGDIKGITNASDLDTVLYRKNLWPATQGKFDGGATLRVIDNVNGAVPSGVTNMTNGVRQWHVTSDIMPQDTSVLYRIPGKR